MITVEEGSIGAFGARVPTLLGDSGSFDEGLKTRTITLPDDFHEHDKPERIYVAAGLDTVGIVAKAPAAFGKIDETASSLIA